MDIVANEVPCCAQKDACLGLTIVHRPLSHQDSLKDNITSRIYHEVHCESSYLLGFGKVILVESTSMTSNGYCFVPLHLSGIVDMILDKECMHQTSSTLLVSTSIES